jgi:glutathione S-transferase
VSDLHLIIGNKNYSSWSLRPWLAMSVLGIPFRETVIPLDMADTAARIGEHSGAGRVPVLHDGGLTVWESLAILEYLAERFPQAGLWPAETRARAIARAIACEMHASFTALRNACPMNLRRPRKAIALDDAVQKDVARILEIWRQCRKSFGKGGAFLFGGFSAADAMYAPVVTRLDTYDIAVDDDARAYMEAIMSLPAFRQWKAAGAAEPWRIEHDEVD